MCQETCLFSRGVKLPVDENTPVQVLLSSIAKVFVLFQNPFEGVGDVCEFLVCRIFVPVHFILHVRLAGRDWTASHDVEEVRAFRMRTR